ncbi:tyrosine-type recombinase/integrase [Paracoccus sp. SCSIO 75233]|uniref:tyrosine-type recombinase/integrase n=1 Tax=Paracoccus sp. SCSIO 75233 TaxID=3017782 RepID=UPI0022F0CBE8|nr:tyrosine-type recombinase/integrase [Paracoccus sp. SCSIO 75233]WBU53579.1 tyrosine-type recombinase/integrase [Paracoccus sp. SCSIO 75233]
METDSRSEAVIRAKPLAATYLSEFEAYRTGRSPLDMDFSATAMEWRQDYLGTKPGTEDRMDYDDALEDHAVALARKDPELADRLRGLVRGEFILTTEHLDAYFNVYSDQVTAKTADMRRSDIQEFAGKFPTTDKITKKHVKRWATELEATGLKRATITRKLGALRGYWRFMQDREIIDRDDNPFADVLGHQSKSQGKSQSDSWVPFSDVDVLKLLRHVQGARKPDQQLADLIRLGMWTGCRIEELCMLRVENVSERSLKIIEAKTQKGIREIPIHASLAPTLERLCRDSKDGYVLSGLETDKYGQRSGAIGKRFGRLKQDHGFGRSHVFHSIRKTVVTILENAEVPEGVVADIVGHEKKTITFGLYSGGSSLERKAEALAHLKYAGWTLEDANPTISGSPPMAAE